MSFEKTKLLRHPTVEKAYESVKAAVGLGHSDVKVAVRAAEVYSTKADKPKAEVAAALLFVCHAYPQVVDTLGPRVKSLTNFAIQMAGYHSVVQAKNGNVDQADIILAQLVVAAQEIEKEIKKSAFYMFDTMQSRIKRLNLMADFAVRAGGDAALAKAAQNALIMLDIAQSQRIDKVRCDSAFAKSGLPAHPLVEKVYEAERYHDFKVNPHVAPLSLEIEMVRILMAEVDHLEPAVIAATLLNQCFGPRAERIEHLYGPRVAELHAASAPRLGLPALDPDWVVKGAADIRAAGMIVATHSWRDECQRTPKKQREEVLCDIEAGARKLRALVTEGQLSPRMARRVETEALAAEAVVHAPENTAMRKPGTPKPQRGW